MKKKLLLLTVLFSMSIGFSQSYGTYEIDPGGKLYYQAPNSFQNNATQTTMVPQALALDWSNPDFDISANPTQDSWDVRMAVGNTGNAYVVYNDNHSNGLQKIMF